MNPTDIVHPTRAVASHRPSILVRLKQMIWLYFWLLILEGAVRKWIPGMSNPFLIIRDPIAVAIWYLGARTGCVNKYIWRFFTVFALLITILGLVQVIVLAIPFAVFLFGWRSYVLHLPVIFVIASVMTYEDLRKIGKWILISTLPMVVLMLLQYASPPDGWLNRGASGDAGQLPSALGHIRPAGTFSFINGPSSFLPLVAAFVLAGLADRKFLPRGLVISAGIALLIVLPFTGSRTIAIEIAILLMMAMLAAPFRAASSSTAQISKSAVGIIVAAVLAVGLYQIPFVQDGLATFTARWNEANSAEGGSSSAIGNRGLGSFMQVLEDAADAPLLGIGIGAGSNFASSFQHGFTDFSLGEGAWEREIKELGSLLGLVFVALRTIGAIVLVMFSLSVIRDGRVLSWYLLAGSVNTILVGLLDQPTAQGFLVLSTALILVGLKARTYSLSENLESSQ